MAGAFAKWLHAQANLAWRVVVHYARRVLRRHEVRGSAAFRANYLAEGLPPADAAWRSALVHAGRCTTCHACDEACPLLTHGTPGAASFIGPMALVVAGARSAPHLDDVRASLDVLTGEGCRSCRACVAACPEGIAILDVAAAARGQLSIIDDARAAQR